MSEPLTDDESMRQLLEDVRRHLLWAEAESGPGLLVDHAVRAALAQAAAALPTRPQAPAGEPGRTLDTGSLRERLFGASGPGARPAAAAAAKAPAPPRPAEPPARPPVPPHAGQPPARPLPAREPQRPMPAAPARPEVPAAAPVARPLDEIRREIGDCRRCKLCEGRRSIVFGVGNPRAELVFVGEGPGAEEDAQGVPFVGAAGQLLTKMIEAMGFHRDDVYICNVVKCRPPGNRNPEPDEIAACEPFLQAQLASVQPRVIVALGKFAAQTLLRDTTPITRLRGQWREYQGIRLMPTFHPAYLLRNPAEKKSAWQDLQQVMKLFGKLPQGR